MNNHALNENDLCPLCRMAKYRFLFKVKDYQHVTTTKSFSLVRCENCDVGYLVPFPAKEEVDSFYVDSFYISHDGVSKEDNAELLLERRSEQLENKAKLLPEVDGGKLMDIGAQKGDFIHWISMKGWDVHGVELPGKVNNFFSHPMTYGDFLTIDIKKQHYDCVTMWAVLEHVYDPAGYVKKISESLKSGGSFIGIATNLNSIQGRFFGTDDYPRHLTIYTKKSLKNLLEREGFKIERIWTDQKIFESSVKGFFVYLLKRMLGYSRDEVMDEWHNVADPLLFSCKFRGRYSFVMRIVSVVSNRLLQPIEMLLDNLGHGHILLWKAVKK